MHMGCRKTDLGRNHFQITSQTQHIIKFIEGGKGWLETKTFQKDYGFVRNMFN